LLGTIAMGAKLWDIAAGALLIANAGGILTDLAGDEVFPFDPANYSGGEYNILAAGKKTHTAFLEIFKT